MLKIKYEFLTAATLLLAACGGAPDAVVVPTKNGVEITAPDHSGSKIVFYSPNTVRVTKKSKDGSFDKRSLVVLNNPSDVDVKVAESQDFYTVSSDQLIVKIMKSDGAVQFLRADSTVILGETGKPYFADIQAFDDKGYTVEQKFLVQGDDALYGLGQHQEGFMNYRGKQLLLSQSNVKAINPVLVSNKGYGIFWDNYSLTKFDNQNADTLKLWSEMGDNVDY